MTEPIHYKLGRKSSLWAAFTPVQDGLRPTWQMAVSARSRGGSKVLAPLIETTVLRPLATVRVKNEAYPLTIDWHEPGRGGQLSLGGVRKLGTGGGELDWEMRWLPVPKLEGAFQVEMRLRTTPRCTGSLKIDLASALHQPEVWRLPAAAASGRQAQGVLSAYHKYALGLVALSGEADWSELGGFTLDIPPFSLGGGRLISFCLRFGPANSSGEACAALVTQYAAFAEAALHPLKGIPALDPAAVVTRICAPESYQMKGMERLYLKTPPSETSCSETHLTEEESYCGGGPHEPAGALAALWDWNSVHATTGIPRLVRFGGHGLCADFQVMGRAGEPEPNKGAFWDRLCGGNFTDFAGGATFGLRSNARLARSLFRLFEVTGEPLLKQSAINISHWLLLKQNERGFYDGARVHATRGLEGDGRFLPLPCALDGAEAIRAFTAAYGATGNEVWMKAAWRIAEPLLERMREFDAQPPGAIAGVLLSLLALDAESPNPRLRARAAEWGSWLLAQPLPAHLPSLSPDGLHAGLFDCAQAGFRLFEMARNTAFLRYAFAALSAVPEPSRRASWRTVAAHQSALLSLTGLLPETQVGFDAPRVTLGSRVFTPDPAAAPFLRLTAAGGSDACVEWLPLVCRATDQLLLLMLAPPSVDAVSVWKNGKRPLLKNLRTGLVDTDAPLSPISTKERWANVGLFTVDP
jgi:hypothetical protein